jgi:hypothetical protein
MQRDEERIARFMNDKTMSSSVFDVLQDNFTRVEPNADVNILAAQTLALQFLKRGWLELARFQAKSNQEDNKVNSAL